MLMEMKLIHEAKSNKEIIDKMNLHDFRGIIFSESGTGIIVRFNDAREVELYEEISGKAKRNGINVFDRKRFYATYSKIVTEEMVNSYDNSIDPYFTNDMIGTYWGFSGNQVNTFEEAWKEIKKYASYADRLVDDYKVELRVIKDDKARVI
jgi:hypothetical protein